MTTQVIIGVKARLIAIAVAFGRFYLVEEPLEWCDFKFVKSRTEVEAQLVDLVIVVRARGESFEETHSLARDHLSTTVTLDYLVNDDLLAGKRVRVLSIIAVCQSVESDLEQPVVVCLSHVRHRADFARSLASHEEELMLDAAPLQMRCGVLLLSHRFVDGLKSVDGVCLDA